MADKTVKLIFTGEDRVSVVVDGVEQSVDKLDKSARRGTESASGFATGFDKLKAAALPIAGILAGIAAVAGGLKLAGAVADAAMEWREYAVESARAELGTRTALTSMGRYSDALYASVVATSQQIQSLTNIGDDAVLQGAKFISTYKEIPDSLIPRSLTVMADLAELMGGDTVNAANMLGKASMGLGGELRRMGITIDEDVAKSGDFAKILAQIETQVKGQAVAMRQADGGWKALGNVVGDAKERLGEFVLAGLRPATEGAITLAGTLERKFSDLKATQGFEDLSDAGDSLKQAIERLAGQVEKSGTIESFFNAIGKAAKFAADGLNNLAGAAVKDLAYWQKQLADVNAAIKDEENSGMFFGYGPKTGGDPRYLKELEAQKKAFLPHVISLTEAQAAEDALSAAIGRSVEAYKALVASNTEVKKVVPKVSDEIKSLAEKYDELTTKLSRELKLQGLSDSEKAAAELGFALEDVDKNFGILGTKAVDNLKLLMIQLDLAKGKTRDWAAESAGAAIAFENSFGTEYQAARDLDAYMNSPERTAWIDTYEAELHDWNLDVTSQMVDAWASANDQMRDGMRDMFDGMLADGYDFAAVLSTMLSKISGNAFTGESNILKGTPFGGYGDLISGSGFWNSAMWGQSQASPYDTYGPEVAMGGYPTGSMGPTWGTVGTAALGGGASAYQASGGNLLYTAAGTAAAIGASFIPVIGPMIAPLVGAGVSMGLGALFEDRPQPEFDTVGSVPGSFQSFLGSDSLLSVTNMNSDAEESAGSDAAAIQAVYDQVTGGMQSTFKGIYNILPDSVAAAWDAVSTDGWENVMNSTRATVGLAVEGHLKLWLSGFTMYMGQSLLQATAQEFGEQAGFNNDQILGLSQQWKDLVQSWVDPLVSTMDPAEFAAAYETLMTQFMTGVTGIMNYSSADLLSDYEKSLTAGTYENQVANIDQQISFLTDSLGELAGDEYASAIQSISSLLSSRYEMELAYLGQLKTLQDGLVSSLNEQVSGFQWDTLSPEQRYNQLAGDRQSSWDAAMAAATPDAMAAAVQDYLDATGQLWSQGKTVYGDDWQSQNLGSFESAAAMLEAQVNTLFGDSIDSLLQDHSDTGSAVMDVFQPAIDEVDRHAAALKTATSNVQDFGGELSRIAASMQTLAAGMDAQSAASTQALAAQLAAINAARTQSDLGF